MDIVTEFLDFCGARGFRPERAGFKADGRMVNFLRDAEKKYSKYRGKLMQFPDGGAFGMIYDFSSGENIEEWHSKAKSGLSREELRVLAKQREEARRAEEIAILKKQARFSERLTKLWKAIPEPAEIHPYIQRKNVGMGKTKIRKNGELLIPLFNASGSVTTLQRIPKTCDAKWMLSAASGAVVKGSYHPIVGKTGTRVMVICEGYATGQTIHRALDVTVICAMTAGNLLPVSQIIRKKYPDAVLVFAADHDESETGWKRSNEAAAAIGGAAVFMPETLGHDFNDAGEEETRRIIDLNSAAVIPIPAVEVGGIASGGIVERDELDETPAENFSAEMTEEDWSSLSAASSNEEEEDEEGDADYLEQKRRLWDRPNGLPFKVLGYSKDTHHYYSLAISRIVEIKAGGHSLQKLWLLADSDDWMKAYGQSDKGTILTPKQTYERAIADLIEIGKKLPPFRKDRMCRVFGAWKEGKQFVFNGGNRVRKGERVYRLNQNDSIYVYLAPEEDSTIRVTATPHHADTIDNFVDLCKSFKWENEAMGEMLAGWTFIAPFCNVLPFRPHLFVTGETGSGKSWAIFNSAVRAIEGSVLIAKMSEAKLREKSYHGIRPIIMDESTKRDKDDIRMDQIISLARDASTGKGAVIEVSGKDPANIKFCACLISSNPPLKNLEDENRFFFLRIKEDRTENSRAKFERLQNDVAALFTDGFSDKFIMTGFQLLPVLMQNTAIFKAAVQRKHNARAADVIGSLAAGYWTMTRRGVATEHEADEYIASRSWDSSAVVDSKPEYAIVLDHIMNHKLVEQGSTKKDVPIWRLIRLAMDGDDLAVQTLGDSGIKVQDNQVLFATGRGLSETLRGTKWQDSYKHFLMNIEGADKFKSRWVNKKDKTSGISVPLSACVGVEDYDA